MLFSDVSAEGYFIKFKNSKFKKHKLSTEKNENKTKTRKSYSQMG